MQFIKKLLKLLGVYGFITNLYDTYVFKQSFNELYSSLKSCDFNNCPVFFFPYFHTGGAEKVHLNIIDTVKDQKSYTFFSKTSYNSQFLKGFNDISNVYTLTRFLKNPRTKKKLINLLIQKLSKASLVFGSNNEFYYELIAELPRDLCKIDLIHAFIYPDNEFASEHYSLPVVNKLSKRIVINQKTKSDLYNQYDQNSVDPILKNRIENIYNGIQIAETVTDKSQDEVLKVLYVGRNTQEKRVQIIAEIAEEFQDNDNIKFTAIGEGLDGYFKHLTNVKTVGVKQGAELEAEYQKGNVLLLTSKREGFPLVICEAMTNNVACISTKVGGIPFLLESGIDCYLVEPENEEEIILFMVSKLKYLLSNRDKLKGLCDNGRIKVNDTFAYDKFVENYRNLLLN